MTVFTESAHAGGYIVSEANRTRSRDEIVVAEGNNLPAAAVIGKITASGKYKRVEPGASDGSQTAVAILFAATDASASDKQATATTRDSEVHLDELDWPEGISDGQKDAAIAQLAERGIIGRSGEALPLVQGASQLMFDDVPEGGEVNEDLGPVTVRVENAQGTLMSGDNETEVTLAKATGAGDLTVTGGATKTVVNGVATFDGIEFDQAGTYTLQATASGLTTATSGDIEVTPGD